VISESLPVWEAWQDEIADLIGAATGLADVQKRLAAWAQANAGNPDIAETIYRSSLQADLGGQLFVRVVEVPEAESKRALAADSRPSFLSLPFEDAIQTFLERDIISPEEFQALSDAARTRAFTATNLATDTLVRLAYSKITVALGEGTTLREFAQAIREGEASLGISASDPAYVENVYRTNVASAYGAGRYRQITSPAVQAARPYVEYRTAGDSRVRPNHRRLNGLIFRQDDPAWPKYAPPNGFQCRCSIVVRRASDVDPSRVVDASTLGPEYDPDPGWASAPTVILD
jgi:SPP1 gp7 family putative phage head morphogenesis protein